MHCQRAVAMQTAMFPLRSLPPCALPPDGAIAWTDRQGALIAHANAHEPRACKASCQHPDPHCLSIHHHPPPFAPTTTHQQRRATWEARIQSGRPLQRAAPGSPRPPELPTTSRGGWKLRTVDDACSGCCTKHKQLNGTHVPTLVPSSPPLSTGRNRRRPAVEPVGKHAPAGRSLSTAYAPHPVTL